MKKLILTILNKIPYKSKFGLRLDDLLKTYWYRNVNDKFCFCGGKIYTKYNVYSEDNYGYEIFCSECEYLFAED